ncbi:MAG: zinc ribbon domain-containing protein [Deltaproteobacteria bacterium]|nr:MAG: zinc ribbon domain-containing protein [Deltaproteobacteria bacterium]
MVDKQPRSCPACGHVGVYQKRVDHYVSLFFIPLFPVKRGTPFLMCEKCNTILDEHGARMDFEQTRGENRCPSCGRTVGRDFVFCPYCGKAL